MNNATTAHVRKIRKFNNETYTFQNDCSSKSKKRSTYNNLSKSQIKIIAGYYLPEFIHNNRNQKAEIQNLKD